MSWIVLTILTAVIAVLTLAVGRWVKGEGKRMKADTAALALDGSWSTTRKAEKDREAQGWILGGNVILILTVVVFMLIVGLSTVSRSIHQVPAEHSGIVYTFGDITNQTSAGLQLIWPWQELESADTRIQTWMFTDDESRVEQVDGAKLAGHVLSSFTEETQDVFIDATLNIEVDPGEIQELYRNVGDDYFGKLVPTRVRQLFKNETVKYRAVEIAPNRETIRADVEALLTEALEPYSIKVKALLIDDISFRP